MFQFFLKKLHFRVYKKKSVFKNKGLKTCFKNMLGFMKLTDYEHFKIWIQWGQLEYTYTLSRPLTIMPYKHVFFFQQQTTEFIVNN